MSTNVWVIGVGELGKVLRGQIRDASGAIDLSLFASVKVRVKTTSTSVLLVNAACVPDVNQATEVGSTGKGWLSFTTEATAAALAIRSPGYLMNFELMDGATPRYWPLNRRLEQTYLKFIVQPV